MNDDARFAVIPPGVNTRVFSVEPGAEDEQLAARLDGFGPVRTFLRITLPLITPTLLFLSVALTVFGLQAFAPTSRSSPSKVYFNVPSLP